MEWLKNIMPGNKGDITRLSDKDASKEIKKVDFEKLLDQEIKTPVFELGTVESIARLVVELKKKLPEFDTVISDDASGRLVSLILHKVINESRKRLGKAPAKIFFINASVRHEGRDKENAVREFLTENKESFGKTLVATEYIQTGNSVLRLMDRLEEAGVDFDFATVSAYRDPYVDANFINDDSASRFRQKLYYGSIGDDGLTLYNKPKYAGITSREDDNKTAHPAPLEHPQPKLIKAAREDVDAIAKELIKLLD